jgi:hypothetical protein
VNVHFLTGLQSDEGSLSGGSWNASYPITNIQTTQPGDVARSTNDTASNTRFILDAGSSQSWQMFAFINHNFSHGAEIRIRVADHPEASPAGSLDVTLTVDLSTVTWGSLPWGGFPWSGSDADFPGGFTAFYVHTASVAGRYVIVDITDESNSDGYVQFGRFLAGVPFVPTENIQYGFEIGIADPSRIERAKSGTPFSQTKPKYRRASGNLRFLTETEALSSAHEIMRGLGISGGLLAVIDPDDEAGILNRRLIYGTLTDPGALVHTSVASYPYGWSFSLEELVAEDS